MRNHLFPEFDEKHGTAVIDLLKMCKYLLLLLIFKGICISVKAQDTLRLAQEIPKPKDYIIPAVFIGYGLISLRGDNVVRRIDYTSNNEVREDHPAFVSKVDNFSRYIPALAVYGLDLAGIKAKHNFMDRSIMLVMSAVLMQGSVSGVKRLTNRMRPNGTARNSFPSGHTSFAFMSAEFLHQEYKDQSIWYGVAGYAIASGTGILRLYNNAHWFSDVVAGAGFGILSTKLVYLMYPYLNRKLFRSDMKNLSFNPGYHRGSLTFNLVKRF